MILLLSSVLLLLLYRVNGSERIVGGSPASIAEFPFAVGLKTSISSRPICGGSLISNSAILTAAHCTGIKYASIGCYDMEENDEEGCQVFQIVNSFVHANYTKIYVPKWDYQVLQINEVDSEAKPLRTSATITNLIGMNFELKILERLTVLGWGATKFEGFASNILLQTDVEIVPNQFCDDQYSVTLPRVVEDNMLCAMGDGKDSCSGDSGGPLLYRCDNDEQVQVGIVSWGVGCAAVAFPGVYSRVSYALDFIFESLEEISKLRDSAATTYPKVISSVDNLCSQVASDQNETTINSTVFNYTVYPSGVPTFSPTLSPSSRPTPFPTFPSLWRCNPRNYGTGDGCHCGCGYPDPDCEMQSNYVFGCSSSGAECIDGICSDEDSVPTEWTCDKRFYDANDGCDCACGVLDPDCVKEGNKMLFNCDAGEICDQDGECIIPAKPIPLEWTCDQGHYDNEDGCDCNCGAFDPDCDKKGQMLWGCNPITEICDSDGICHPKSEA